MSIRVECPNGHVFKVKDKYSGKKGLCPHCDGDVVVVVPELISDDEIVDQLMTGDAPTVDDEGDSIHDDHPSDQETGLSLLSSSIVRQQKKCPACGERSPIWYASCHNCGQFFDDVR